MIFLTMVVLPALSNPLREHVSESTQFLVIVIYSIKIRISLSFNLAFRNIDNILLSDVEVLRRRAKKLSELCSWRRQHVIKLKVQK